MDKPQLQNTDYYRIIIEEKEGKNRCTGHTRSQSIPSEPGGSCRRRRL